MTVPPHPNRSSNIVIVASIAAVTILGALLMHYLLREKVEVRLVHAGYEDLIATVSTNGKIEPIENFAAYASPGGTVTQLPVHEGERVHKGQLLVAMNPGDARAKVAQAQADLKQAELDMQAVSKGGSHEEQLTLAADLANARREAEQAKSALAATEKLQASGAASPAELAAARQRNAAAETALHLAEQRKSGRYSALDIEHAKAQLANAQQAYAAAQSDLETVETHAPFDGTVYSVPVRQYDFVNMGDDLVRVADLTRLRVRAYFDEPEIGKLSIGQPVRIVWDAKPGMAWHGHIQQVPNTIINYGTRNVGVALISVDDPDGQLLPNTNVTVTVTTLARQHVLTVPREALRTEGTADYVYVVTGHTINKHAITVGGVNLTQVEVTSGLNNGDAVAVGFAGSVALSDNLHVDTFR